jgi:hypothetical protein
MKINYSLKIEDIIAFQKKILKKKNFIYKPYVFGIVLLLAFYLRYVNEKTNLNGIHTMSGETVELMNYWTEIVFNFVILVGLIFLVRFINIAILKGQAKSNPSIIGEKELIITNESVVFISKYYKTEYQYAAFQKIENERDHYFLYTDEIIAIILPKRTIGSDEFIKQLDTILKK